MASLTPPQGQYSRSEPQLASLRKWDGGLRLDLDPYNLTPSMTPDMCDVEVDSGGSICTRRPLESFAKTNLDSTVCGVWNYQTEDGDDFTMFALEDGSIVQITNGPGPVVKSVFPNSSGNGCCWHSWQANGLLYVSDGVKVYEWDGTNKPKDVTTKKIHDNEESEQDIEMKNYGVPPSCVATNWSEAVWLAQPKTDYGEDEDAVWFSGQLGKYDELDGKFGGQKDFFSKSRLVAQTDALGDDIVALTPCGDTLFVFKHGSTHAVSATGDDLSTFAIKEVSRDFGAAGPKASICSLGLVWLYDARQGPMVITKEGAEVVGSRLGDIAKRNMAPDKAAVGFCGQKVYFSIAEKTSECNDITYVFDQETKTWTCMSVGFDCFYNFCPTKGRAYCLGATSKPCKSVVWLDGDEDNDTLIDDFGCKKQRFYPYVQTAWFDGSLPGVEKRWTGIDAQIEMATLPVCLRIGATTNWLSEMRDPFGVEWQPDDGGCLLEVVDGCVPEPIKCYERIASGRERVLTSVQFSGIRSPASSTTKEVRVKPCVSKSAGIRIESGKSGRWCLRQVFTYHYAKRIR